MHVSHQFVAAVTLTAAAAFFAGRGYEQAKARFAVWRGSGETRRFGGRLRALTIVCLLAGVAVLAVQARGGR